MAAAAAAATAAATAAAAAAAAAAVNVVAHSRIIEAMNIGRKDRLRGITPIRYDHQSSLSLSLSSGLFISLSRLISWLGKGVGFQR